MGESGATNMQRVLDENVELRRELERRHTDLEQLQYENRELSERYVAVERRNTELAHLYVATHRLHESLSRAGVLLAIKEIIANLIGSEQYAVFEVNVEGAALSLIDSCGIDRHGMERIDLGQGIIGHVASTATAFVNSPADHRSAGGITACIPLQTHGSLIGAIAIFGLLQQKAQLEPLDYELLDLLASHAAVALRATRADVSSSTIHIAGGKECL